MEPEEDIIERLSAIGKLPIRDTMQFGDVFFDARDEIERLRALLQAWHRIRGMPDRAQWIDEAGWQRAMDLYVETGRALEGK